MLLESNEFLEKLSELYAAHQNTGTVRLQFKRVSDEGKKKAEGDAKSEPVCLVRASDGKQTISTQINQGKSAEFQNRLGALMRSTFLRSDCQ